VNLRAGLWLLWLLWLGASCSTSGASTARSTQQDHGNSGSLHDSAASEGNAIGPEAAGSEVGAPDVGGGPQFDASTLPGADLRPSDKPEAGSASVDAQHGDARAPTEILEGGAADGFFCADEIPNCDRGTTCMFCRSAEGISWLCAPPGAGTFEFMDYAPQCLSEPIVQSRCDNKSDCEADEYCVREASGSRTCSTTAYTDSCTQNFGCTPCRTDADCPEQFRCETEQSPIEEPICVAAAQ